MLIFSGLATGLLVFVINHAANNLLVGAIEGKILLLYLVTFFLYSYTQKYVLSEMLYSLNRQLYQLRINLIDKMMSYDLSKTENLTSSDLHNNLVQEFNFIAHLLPWVSYTAQASVVLIFCLIYLAWLSFNIFLLVLLFLSAAILWHLFIEEKIHQEYLQLIDKEKALSQCILNILPETASTIEKIEILEDIKNLSSKSESLVLTIDKQTINSVMSVRISLFLLLAIFVFVFPIINPDSTDLVFNIVGVTFFIMGPVSQLAYALPILLRLDASFHSIYTLEAQLENISTKD